MEQATPDDVTSGRALTLVRLAAKAEVGVIDGWLHFWDGGREVRVGPLAKEQAETLNDELGYEAAG